MAITREKKATILANLKDVLSNTASVVFVHFKGLSVDDANELRGALKKEGVKYMVTKKTLLKKTLNEQSIEGDMPSLDGELAFAYLPTSEGDDITAPARTIGEFVKKFKDQLAFLGGIVDGKYISKEEAESVAAIPPTPVLRGMFVNIVNSPIQRMAIVLNAVAEKKS